MDSGRSGRGSVGLDRWYYGQDDVYVFSRSTNVSLLTTLKSQMTWILGLCYVLYRRMYKLSRYPYQTKRVYVLQTRRTSTKISPRSPYTRRL